MKSINYYWRLLATGLSFCFFGLGGLLLWIAIFPLSSLFPSSKAQIKRRAQWCVHFGFYTFIGFMHRMGVMTYEINGLERLNRSGQLIIANHPTLIDVVFLISRIPFASCIVKETLWHNLFTRGPVINAGYISNGNTETMISDSVDYLKAGGTMVIFPEGTRTIPGLEYKFQRSTAHIALQANAIVTPVLLSCSPTTLTKGKKWYQIPERRFHLAMQIENDIVLDDFLAIEPRTIAVRRFNQYLLDYFSQRREHDEQHGK